MDSLLASAGGTYRLGIPSALLNLTNIFFISFYGFTCISRLAFINLLLFLHVISTDPVN